MQRPLDLGSYVTVATPEIRPLQRHPSLATLDYVHLRHFPNRVFQADCAICSDGYSANLGFSCKKCSNSIGGIVVAIVFTLVVAVAVIPIVSYLLSPELGPGTKRACIGRLVGYIPLNSIKIVIVAWQIVTQVRSTEKKSTLCRKIETILCKKALTPHLYRSNHKHIEYL